MSMASEPYIYLSKRRTSSRGVVIPLIIALMAILLGVVAFDGDLNLHGRQSSRFDFLRLAATQ